ncbi:MAG: BlaI/MecI/CopY family transcriptional regulator [Bacteroidia bacterium]|uniref:Penicillinase repressor n=1 Tax=bioreactor metagenome TaxID=1076179 RepID=A0A645A2C7_9ZZZZ|nr:BlaI/MecI/CopY family transcriptional regulator [Rikenellaceae bacterium]NCB19739.1 BlaI/MecI/CopY family transcriptional regulator [Bacteroidia bacterium]
MEKKRIKELTKAELQVMQFLWSMERAYVNDLLEMMPEPKPAYNTVSTIVRILEKKGFVSHESFGKTHRYYPLIDRDSYLNSMMKRILNSFFAGSVSNMVSFLSKKEGLSVDEVGKMMEIIENGKKQEQ